MIKINAVKTTNEETKVKAFANVVFGNSFKITNISIIENSKNGELFVSMPRYRSSELGEDGQPVYKDVCNPITKEFREELYTNILATYEKAVNDHVAVMTVGEKERDKVAEPKHSVRMHALDKEGSNVKAVGQIYIEDSFIINNINVIEGKKGLFVTMPSYKTKKVDEEGKAVYQDICYPVTKDFRDKLFASILDGYAVEKDKAAPEVEKNMETELPFKGKDESKDETKDDDKSDKAQEEKIPTKKGKKK
jgi:DNA-binding cell septation regulator SpoVG